MQELLSVIMTMAALAILASVVDLLCSGSQARAYARFACGLLLMLSLLSPLSRLIKALPEQPAAAPAQAEAVPMREDLLALQLQEAAEAAGFKILSISQRDGRADGAVIALRGAQREDARRIAAALLGIGEGNIAFR